MSSKDYNPRQISCIVNNKAVIELINKLRPSDGSTSTIHRKKGETNTNGFAYPSRIGINIVDYASEPSVFVQENLSPSQLRELHNETIMKRKDYNFSGNGQKIFGEPDKDGFSKVRTLQIVRQGSYVSGGKVIVKNFPWTVKIQNGKGVKETNKKTGGTMIKPGTFQIEKQATINLSDGDFFALIDEAVSFMNAWESYYAHKLIAQNEKIIYDFEQKNRELYR